MMHEKRRYPALLWLYALLFTVLITACGLFFNWKNNPSALFQGTFPGLDGVLFTRALPLVYTALIAAGLCLAAGFILGGLLALTKHRTGILSTATPIFILAGGILLFHRQLAPYLPQPLSNTLIQAGINVHPAISIAVILLPLMMICTGSFALALDPKLYKAALSLGASPAGTYAVFLFPRLLLKAIPCYIAILPCALALALANDPLPDFAPDTTLTLCVALTSTALIMLSIICLFTRKTRRISPC